MPIAACSFCKKRYLGQVTTAFHRWWEGDVRQAWRQRACPRCVSTCWDPMFKYAAEWSGDLMELPLDCMNCGRSSPTNNSVVFHTLYLGKAKRQLYGVLCADCIQLVSPYLIQGGERLEDRMGAGTGGSGGADHDAVDVLDSLGRLP